MKHRIGLATAALAATTTLLAAPAPAQAAGLNCVDGPEWNRLNTSAEFGTANHSARRVVIERAWNAFAVGAPNSYWKPGNEKLYAIAYHWCGDRHVKVVVAYRRTSNAWQYAFKG